ncbi:MAG: ABC transporter ATP-binding protein [Deltaproteobacteria bacterium]|nr:ABC transporter ATP-binding protein [Deltaproteobacteria bacterium]
MRLDISGLSKQFVDEKSGALVPVLDGLDLRVEPGQFVSIVGPSGCGKTTLLRIVAGLEPPGSGRVLLDDREIDYAGDRIGLVFQDYALFPWRTTLQNIEMGLEIMGVPKAERRPASMAYVKSFGLTGFENAYPKALSGGMKQRVAIARTLITDPKVVLMDEPFGSLDSQTRNELQEFLLDLWQRNRKTILFVTHNVDEAVFLSDHIVILSRRPAGILKTSAVTCARPRDRTSSECNDVRREVLSTLARERSETAE